MNMKGPELCDKGLVWQLSIGVGIMSCYKVNSIGVEI